MAAYLIDIDGTTAHYHTGEWMPGVVERLTALAAAGNQIIFVTMRGPQDEGQRWSVENTKRMLASLPFPHMVIFGVQSTRILIDDVPGRFIQATHNNAYSWLYQT